MRSTFNACLIALELTNRIKEEMNSVLGGLQKHLCIYAREYYIFVI